MSRPSFNKRMENFILDSIASISPWLTPLIPTYFAAYNAYEYLTKGKNWWDMLSVVVIALVVETVGLSGVHTAIQFWNWNRTKLKSDASAPLWIIMVAVGMYVAIIILVNALMDFFAVSDPAALPYVKILVVALLSLLSLNSALIVALRASQNDRITQAEQAREERRQQRSEKRAGNLPETFPSQAVSYRKNASAKPDWRHFDHDERLRINSMSVRQIVVAYGVQPRTARNWKTNARQYAASLSMSDPSASIQIADTIPSEQPFPGD